MIVTLALAGPLTQSVLVTGGNFDSAVGPGVGFWVMTVQPASGGISVFCGTKTTVVGAGLAMVEAVVDATLTTLVVVAVGDVCAWGRHPASVIATSIHNDNTSLRIHSSEDRYLAILPAKS